MSFGVMFRKSNKPLQTSEYDKMLQDLDTVTRTAQQKYGSSEDAPMGMSYAQKQEGLGKTRMLDTQRRVQNQANVNKLGQMADTRNLQIQAGVQQAMKDREMMAQEFQEKQRQTQLNKEADIRQAQQQFENQWREIQAKRSISELTNLDKLALAAQDANLAMQMAYNQVRQGFSLQDIRNNYKIMMNEIENDFKDFEQKAKLDYEKWVARFQARSRNMANILNGITQVAAIGLTQYGDEIGGWFKGLFQSSATFPTTNFNLGIDTGQPPVSKYSLGLDGSAGQYATQQIQNNWNLGVNLPQNYTQQVGWKL